MSTVLERLHKLIPLCFSYHHQCHLPDLDAVTPAWNFSCVWAHTIIWNNTFVILFVSNFPRSSLHTEVKLVKEECMCLHVYRNGKIVAKIDFCCL